MYDLSTCYFVLGTDGGKIWKVSPAKKNFFGQMQ